MLTPGEITKKWETIADTKAELPPLRCFLLAVLAGMYIALGAVGYTIVQASVEGGMGRLLGACVFPAGLILVVLAGGELFTGNCLMAGPAVNGRVKWRRVMRNWGVVYLGNMLGALLMACIVLLSGMLENAGLALAAAGIAADKCSLPFADALLRGFACNILVCGAVWMASGADGAGGKAACCFFPVMLFVLCGFEHSVANMYYVPLGLVAYYAESPLISQAVRAVDHFCVLTPGHYLLNNLLPVTLGNILGGAGLAAVYARVYHD